MKNKRLTASMRKQLEQFLDIIGTIIVFILPFWKIIKFKKVKTKINEIIGAGN